MKIIDLGYIEGHWKPVRSAILATAGLLVTILQITWYKPVVLTELAQSSYIPFTRSSNHQANKHVRRARAFLIDLLDVCSIIARCLLDRVKGVLSCNWAGYGHTDVELRLTDLAYHTVSSSAIRMSSTADDK